MGPGFVVMADPFGNDRLRLGVRFESMLPDTLELERAHERFGNAVLLGRMRQNKLLV